MVIEKIKAALFACFHRPGQNVYAAIVFIILFSGCAGSPGISEVQLSSGQNGLFVRDLYCPASGYIVAIGSTSRAKQDGIALYSKDRGATWHRAALEPPATGVALTLAQLPSGGPAPRLYASGYRSLNPFSDEPAPWWVSEDGGRTWSSATFRLPLGKPRGFSPSFPKIVAADQTGTLVAVVAESTGLLSNGVFLLRSTDSGEHWDKRLLKMPTDHASPIVSDGKGHLAFFGSSIPGHPFSAAYESGVYWSSDAGATWREGKAPANKSFLFTMSLYRSTPSGDMVAFNTTQRKYGSTVIFHSADNGQSWEKSSGPGEFGTIIGITGDGRRRIVALTDFGNVLLSDDAGVTWRNAGRPAVSSKRLHCAASPMIFAGQKTIIAAAGSKIIRSSDGGDTWVTTDSRLPDADHCFSTLCTDGNGLIVAAGGGMIMRSVDFGITWDRGKVE